MHVVPCDSVYQVSLARCLRNIDAFSQPPLFSRLSPPVGLSVFRELDYIFENNRKWVEDTLVEDPETFKRLAQSQSPKYMYIGCSDSRVPAQNMMGLTTGELFVVRNVVRWRRLKIA
ncbi:unnamed protein product [Discosporangium mesarthrocarpum]